MYYLTVNSINKLRASEMKKFGVGTILILILATSVTFAASRAVYAAASSSAKVLDIQGEATYLKAGSSTWSKLLPTTVLNEGDTIKTSPDSEVRLELSGAAKTAEVTVRQETEFRFDTFRHDEAKVENTLLNVGVGGVLVKAEKLIGDSKFEVKTPTSIVGIRGTIFEVNVPKPQQ